MAETSKKIAILMVILFATSLIMGVAFARVSINDEYDQVKETARDYSQEIARLQAELQFHKDVAAALLAQHQEAKYFEEKSDAIEEELYFTIHNLENEIDKLKNRGGNSILIYTPGGY